MRILFFSVITGMITVVSCNSNPRASNNSFITKEEVLAFIKKYDTSWNNKMVSFVDSSLATSYVYFTSTGGLTTRERTLEFLGSNEYKINSADRSEIDIWIDGNTAIVSSHWKGEGVWSGGSFKDNQRCGMVIQKQNNQLKLLTEHCVEIKQDSSGL